MSMTRFRRALTDAVRDVETDFRPDDWLVAYDALLETPYANGDGPDLMRAVVEMFVTRSDGFRSQNHYNFQWSSARDFVSRYLAIQIPGKGTRITWPRQAPSLLADAMIEPGTSEYRSENAYRRLKGMLQYAGRWQLAVYAGEYLQWLYGELAKTSNT